MLTRNKPTATNLNSYIVVNNYPKMINNNRSIKAKSELQIRKQALLSSNMKRNELTYRSLDKFSLNSTRKQSNSNAIPIKKQTIHENSSNGSSTPTALSTRSTSPSSSSSSFEEEVDNLNDLLYSVRKRIDMIEANYSIDSLFNCLKHYLKHNCYSYYSINFLETFRNKLASMPPIALHMDKDYESVKRNTLRNSMSPDTLRSVMEPVKKLFKNLNLLRRIYKIIQRDLIFNVLVKSLPETGTMPSSDKNDSMSMLTKQSSKLEVKQKHLDLNYETRRFTLKSRINISNTKNLKRLNKYHQILYELNEKVLILLNNKDNSDLKLLSNQTRLAQKYDYYKSGEYVLRLVPDIIYKIKVILKLCQKCYELSDKFNLNSSELLNDSKHTITTTTTTTMISNHHQNMQQMMQNNGNNNFNRTQSTLLSNDKLSSKMSDYDYMSKDEIKYTINKRHNKSFNSNDRLPKIKEKSKSPEPHTQQKYSNNSDFYIRETDSSVLSDDSNHYGYENYKSRTPKKNKKKRKKIVHKVANPLPPPPPAPQTAFRETPSEYIPKTFRDAETSILVENYQNSIKQNHHHQVLPPIQTKNNRNNDYTTGTQQQQQQQQSSVNNVENNKERDELYDEYLHKKDEIAECENLIEELHDDLANLIDRTERCAAIKDRINSVISVIRETETHLNNTNSEDKEVKNYLQKELNLLKYRLNLLTQDLDVEEVVKNELNDAIKETNRKLNKAQSYLDELRQQFDKLDNEIKILYKEFF